MNGSVMTIEAVAGGGYFITVISDSGVVVERRVPEIENVVDIIEDHDPDISVLDVTWDPFWCYKLCKKWGFIALKPCRHLPGDDAIVYRVKVADSSFEMWVFDAHKLGRHLPVWTDSNKMAHSAALLHLAAREVLKQHSLPSVSGSD